jgi:hypothetical protein
MGRKGFPADSHSWISKNRPCLTSNANCLSCALFGHLDVLDRFSCIEIKVYSPEQLAAALRATSRLAQTECPKCREGHFDDGQMTGVS